VALRYGHAPQRLKPLPFAIFTARLKPCPDVNQVRPTTTATFKRFVHRNSSDIEIDDVEGVVLDEFAALLYVFAH
jgi:hypothetical protein